MSRVVGSGGNRRVCRRERGVDHACTRQMLALDERVADSSRSVIRFFCDGMRSRSKRKIPSRRPGRGGEAVGGRQCSVTKDACKEGGCEAVGGRQCSVSKDACKCSPQPTEARKPPAWRSARVDLLVPRVRAKVPSSAMVAPYPTEKK